MTSSLQQKRIDRFLKHQRLWGVVFVVGWFMLNMLVLSTTTLMEYQRVGKPIAVWEPFCWEISSVIMLLILIPLGILMDDKWLRKLTFKARIFVHSLATLPFSVIHVAGMVGIRQLWYALMESHYSFGNVPLEFLYEYRKDAQAYLTIAVVVFGYRFILRRLRGEATYLAESDEGEYKAVEDVAATPERLLIKKLGREFLIHTRDIEWVEASGNYANLHIRNSVYPMRITMDKLEKSLPRNFARIHRSTVVNLNHVKHLEALDSGDYEITLISDVKLALSRRYRENFKNVHSID